MPDKRDNPNRIERDAFEREVGTDLDEETPDEPKGLALHTKILIGLALGVIAGISVNKLMGGDHPTVVWIVDNITQPVGQLFLRLLLMIMVPLVISSISAVIGITLANTIKPGKRIDQNTATALQQRYANDATAEIEKNKPGAKPKPLMSVVETIVPKNPFYAISGKEDANMLHLMFFALVIGIAITLIPATVTAPVLRV